MARIIEVIETKITRGSGTDKDRYRSVYQLWSKKGDLIFEYDLFEENDPFEEKKRKPLTTCAINVEN